MSDQSDFDKKFPGYIEKYESILPQCSVCLNPIYPNQLATLKCGHKLHKYCLARWSGNPRNPDDQRKGCPECRGPLELKVEKGMIRKEIGGRRRRRKTHKHNKSKKNKSKRNMSKRR